MLGATAIARLPEVSAPLQKVDFRRIVIADNREDENPAVRGLAVDDPAALHPSGGHGADSTPPNGHV
jgi:hypothetical protein